MLLIQKKTKTQLWTFSILKMKISFFYSLIRLGIFSTYFSKPYFYCHTLKLKKTMHFIKIFVLSGISCITFHIKADV